MVLVNSFLQRRGACEGSPGKPREALVSGSNQQGCTGREHAGRGVERGVLGGVSWEGILGRGWEGCVGMGLGGDCVGCTGRVELRGCVLGGVYWKDCVRRGTMGGGWVGCVGEGELGGGWEGCA